MLKGKGSEVQDGPKGPDLSYLGGKHGFCFRVCVCVCVCVCGCPFFSSHISSPRCHMRDEVCVSLEGGRDGAAKCVSGVPVGYLKSRRIRKARHP